MCAAGNIHYELNTVARDISYGLSRTPESRCTGGKESTKIREPYDEPPRGEKPYDALRVSGGAGTGRADFLPNARAATTETQHLRGCSRNLWDPAVMRCRAVSQPSQSRGLLETRKISKICRASFMPSYLFRWQFSAASADQHQNCTALTGALDPFCCQAMERLAPYPDMKQ